MIKFVNAKLNLGLNILRKREDGYHELSTLFYPVGLYNGTPENPEPFCDILELTESANGQDEFQFYGNRIDCPLEKNLVYKACRLFEGKLREKGVGYPGYKLSLQKNIPDGAGLGGGSADATFTLRSLNELNGKPLSETELHSMALSLGADCPFFLENRPVIATGIGEIMKPADINLKGYWALIVKPPVYISTKEAFSGVKPHLPQRDIADLVALPPEQWRLAGLHNDFEDSVFPLYPVLKEIKEALYASGAVFSSMSGSGSSLFGLYPHRNGALEALASVSPSLPRSTFATLSLLG